MRARLLAVIAAAGAVAAVIPAHAATGAAKPTPQVTDPTGDANGLNSQEGLLPANPNQATAPASYTNGDIVSVTFATVFKKVHRKKVPTGFTATLTLAAPPTDTHVDYNIDADVSGCDGFVDFDYNIDPTVGANSISCFHATDPTDPTSLTAGATAYAAPPAVVSGNSITWTVPLSTFKVGTQFTGLDAQTLVSPTFAPEIDEASSTNTFTVGK